MLVKDDLDGQALNDLYIVSGGVLRRQQREARAGAGLKAIDVACENSTWICVHPDLDRLARSHPVKLSLLEIRYYPHLLRHEREQRLAGLQQSALLDRLLSYSS